MKAIVSNPDGPEITTVDDPRPGNGEALVAVRAFSVNRGELALLPARTDGWRPGQDIAGVVVEPAADGSGPAAGTGVVALAEQAGWAELAAVPAVRLARLPAGISIEQAAALPLAGLTALRTLRLAGDLLGRRVLVTGASPRRRAADRLPVLRAPRATRPRPGHLASLAAAGRLDPGVSLTLPWTHLRDVLTALTERRITGKAVLTLGLFRAEMVMGRKPHPA